MIKLRGPYDLEKIVNRIITELKKNENYSESSAAEKLAITRWLMKELVTKPRYREEVNTMLRERLKQPVTLKAVFKSEVGGIRLEGCQYGPLGVIRWPLLPRGLKWVETRPKPIIDLLLWLLSIPYLGAS